MKRLPIVCLLMLLCLTLTTSAMASTRATNDPSRGLPAIAPDRVLERADARIGVPGANPWRVAEPANKAWPWERQLAPNQEIGDGKCFEYVLFGFWHVWAGCDDKPSGGGSMGGW